MKSKKFSNILVTGGAGYIGSIMVPDFLENGYRVTVIDNFLYHQTSLLGQCADKNLTIINGDARDERVLKTCLKDADAVFPLACLTGAPVCAKFPLEAKSIILGGVKSILKLKSKDQIIIYPTTNSGYGIGEKGKFCTEKTPLRPVSVYGKLKVTAEQEILESRNSITLRLATAFGLSPRMRLDLLVNDFVYRAVKDMFVILFEANFKRNYIHVRDVSRAFIHMLGNFDANKNQAYNVGLDNANLSKAELCAKIREQIPEFVYLEAPVGSDPDKRDYVVSNEKIAKTGFRPKYTLDMGITELIKGYRIINNNIFGNI